MEQQSISQEILDNPQLMFGFFNKKLQETMDRSESELKEFFNKLELQLSNNYAERCEPYQQTTFTNEQWEIIQAKYQLKELLDRFKRVGIEDFDGKSKRYHFKKSFEHIYRTDISGASIRTWNSVLVLLGTLETSAVTQVIASERMNDDPIDNLNFFLEQTVRSGEERLIMNKLVSFKFEMKDFEKELAEFLEIASNLPPGEFTERAIALILETLLPKDVKSLLPATKVTTISNLINDVRDLLSKRPKCVKKIVGRPSLYGLTDGSPDMLF